jgi:hypothetical protein
MTDTMKDELRSIRDIAMEQLMKKNDEWGEAYWLGLLGGVNYAITMTEQEPEP